MMAVKLKSHHRLSAEAIKTVLSPGTKHTFRLNKPKTNTDNLRHTQPQI